MNVITWDKDDINDTMEMLDMLPQVDNFISCMKKDTLREEPISTELAIAIIKNNLMGEYHGILVRQMEEDLDDAEIYLLTFDGEVSDGGEMVRVDSFILKEIAKGTLFGGSAD